MKKLLIILFLAVSTIIVQAQISLFKPVPKNLFQTVNSNQKVSQTPSVWLWRFSAMVTATELTYDKTSKQFLSAPLSSVGPAIGYKHYTALADNSPYNDWGINFAALIGTDINSIDPASIKAALLLNCFQFVNIGCDYSFGGKTFGILIGANLAF
jgi:hypothetical protein